MREIKTYHDKEALAEAAAQQFIELAGRSIDERDRFAVVLSGGSTPRMLFELLATPAYASQVDWGKVHVFWGDERTVPPDDEDSNYKMAYDTLLRHVAIPMPNIYRMRGEIDAVEAALHYENDLRHFFGIDEFPVFDLIHLGMGNDGHTASLFPGTSALTEALRRVVANHVPQHDTYRITLTAPVINAARQITFLVAGANKATPLNQVLNGVYQPQQLPAQLIQPEQGRLTWMIDESAATEL